MARTAAEKSQSLQTWSGGRLGCGRAEEAAAPQGPPIAHREEHDKRGHKVNTKILKPGPSVRVPWIRLTSPLPLNATKSKL